VAHEAGNWPRVFSREGVHPFDEIEWKIVTAEIRSSKGEVVFRQEGVEVPAWWSQNVVNVVADKYLRMIDGVRENSVRQIFLRVASTIRAWAAEQKYFNTEMDAQIFEEELLYALVHQYGSFNSPVWFNLGITNRRQAASACFINGIDDTVEGIMAFQTTEATIFRGGSGSGANLSDLRSSYEKISAGSYTCGPLSWMEANDRYAQAFKSGGATRNAAKIVILDMDHPDILETHDGRPGFIRCKADEEKLAHILVQNGYSAQYDDPNGAYKRVRYQNANNSVSIPDSFMQAMIDDGIWSTRERKSGKVVHTYKARDLWQEIAKAAWRCGDPGIQFTDTINEWHTTPKAGRIKASNPCSEFLCVDNTACNLCAVNLTKFFDGRKFIYDRFTQAVRIFSTAQMALIDNAEYPTEAITNNSKRLRPIGTNYGDLGALLMRLGLGYDSDEGRAVAARLASLMTGTVYITAAKLAARTAPFPAFMENRDDMLRILRKHQEADTNILKRWNRVRDPLGDDIMLKSADVWREALSLGERHGYSISQASLQAPLGTISFLMGMNTTGIEPAMALVTYKKLVGGGLMKIVNSGVRDALINLGYGLDTVDDICKHIEETGTIEGAPNLNLEHLPVFDCALPAHDGGRYLTPMAHVKMMAAIQPLISCAQSKTVNLPSSVTPEEISGIYQEAWRLGLKCLALYRDGCKASQPLAVKEPPKEELTPSLVSLTSMASVPVTAVPHRDKLPSDINGWRHKLLIDGYKGYVIVNEYPDGRPGEVFLKLGKPGSTVSGLIDGFTQLLSIALQYGVPLPKLISSFVDTRFDPSGITVHPRIRFTTSLYDYLFKVLDDHYYAGEHSGLALRSDYQRDVRDVHEGLGKESSSVPPHIASRKNLDAPPCSRCGSITQRNGSCYFCASCGATTGCS
jgi:ribonucleoside-diphosphate reductase alpha chain